MKKKKCAWIFKVISRKCPIFPIEFVGILVDVLERKRKINKYKNGKIYNYNL